MLALLCAIGFFEHRRISSLADIQPDDASEFVHSRLESGLPASVAVLHNLRAALRLFFVWLVASGWPRAIRHSTFVYGSAR